jgi:hypothetical protein
LPFCIAGFRRVFKKLFHWSSDSQTSATQILPDLSNDAAWNITPGGGLPSQFTSFPMYSYMSLVKPSPLWIARIVISSCHGFILYALLNIFSYPDMALVTKRFYADTS